MRDNDGFLGFLFGGGGALFLILFFLFKGCDSCDTDFSTCKFEKGDDVKIKHKFMHDEATVTDVQCGCTYEISYYAAFGVRRHRIVEEVEIE